MWNVVRRLNRVAILCTVAVSVAVVCSLFMQVTSRMADAAEKIEWSDTRGAKVVTRSVPYEDVTPWHARGCTKQQIEIEVGAANHLRTHDACITKYTNTQLAMYRENSRQIGYALKKVDDERFIALDHYSSYSLSAPGALLLSNGYIVLMNQYSSDVIAILVNDAHKTMFATDNYEDQWPYYMLYGDSYKMIQDDRKSALDVKRIDVSRNGQYVVADVSGVGSGLIDPEAGTIRYIPSGIRVEESGGQDSKVLQAVSSDGRYIARVDATYRQAKVYELTESCGSTKVIDSQTSIRATPCYSVDFSYELKNNVHLQESDLLTLDFLSDERTLVMKTQKLGKMYETTIAPNSDAKRIEYLALGDSYSSGEGDIEGWPRTHYTIGSDGRDICHISSRSYPFLLRDTWGIDSSVMRSVACSGAKISPDYFGINRYNGQHDQLANYDDMKYMGERDRAIYDFNPGVVRQMDFVSYYMPEIITLTGGGNDVGFANIIRYCATSYAPYTCSYATNKQMRANLNREIDQQYGISKIFIENIQYLSPASKVYIVGYPQFISVTGLCLGISPLLSISERTMIHESVIRLNNILKKVARDTGVYYVDIEDSLVGGRICEGSRYMTGPVKAIFTKKGLRPDANMYHPNHRGHQMIALRVASEIASGMTYDIIDFPLEGNGRRVIKKAVLPDYTGVGSTHTVVMDPSMFLPDGRVLIEMFSKRVQLAEVTAAADGSVRAEVTIPKDVGVGVHLLAISGQDINGEPVSVQQFVTVTSDIEGDSDGDGIPDDEDPCFAIDEWIEDDVNVCAPLRLSLNSNQEGRTTQAERGVSLLSTMAQGENPHSIAMGDVFHAGGKSLGIVPVMSGDMFVKKDIDYKRNDYWWIVGGLSILGVIGSIYYAKNQKEKTY